MLYDEERNELYSPSCSKRSGQELREGHWLELVWATQKTPRSSELNVCVRLADRRRCYSTPEAATSATLLLGTENEKSSRSGLTRGLLPHTSATLRTQDPRRLRIAVRVERRAQA